MHNDFYPSLQFSYQALNKQLLHACFTILNLSFIKLSDYFLSFFLNKLSRSAQSATEIAFSLKCCIPFHFATFDVL